MKTPVEPSAFPGKDVSPPDPVDHPGEPNNFRDGRTKGRISSAEIHLGTGRVGCYLIHGFTGSTYELRGLAEYLAQRGLRVDAHVLPGHGTTIQDCNRTVAEDWLEAVEYHFTEFLLTCSTTFVIGLSMGAALALHLASLLPVAGVVAMSPAFIFRNWRRRWLLSLFAPFVAARSKHKVYRTPRGDSPSFYGYDAYPLRALRQVVRLNSIIRAELPQTSSPTLVLHSRTDRTAPLEANTRLVLDSIASQDKQLIAYDNASHVLLAGSAQEQVWADIFAFINRVAPTSRAVPLHQPR